MDAAPPPANRLGRYRLVAEIARGGMGIVYLAVTTGPARFRKRFVIKELKPELVSDAAFTNMFLEEARLAARLNHPNIVQTLDVGVEGERHYLVMDYLEGVTLRYLLGKRSAAFTREMTLRVICEVLHGLDYAHMLKDFDGSPRTIVHRDVTPSNVFVTFDGQAKLMDFGIAKAVDSVVRTRTGVLKGKPGYMAPEQMHGKVDTRSDVFAAGIMIWEAASGRRMWQGKGDVQVLTSLLRGEVPSLKDAAPNAPTELVSICERALTIDADARYQRAADLAADLEAYLRANGKVSMQAVAAAAGSLCETERKASAVAIERALTRAEAMSEEAFIDEPPPATGQAPASLPAPTLVHPASMPVPRLEPAPGPASTRQEAASQAQAVSPRFGALGTHARLVIPSAIAGIIVAVILVVPQLPWDTGRTQEGPAPTASPPAPVASRSSLPATDGGGPPPPRLRPLAPPTAH